MFTLTKIATRLAILTIVSFVFITACKKENTQTDVTADNTVEMAEQAIKVSQFISSSFFQAPLASVKVFGLKEDDTVLQERDACSAPTIVPFDLTTFPKTFTSDYGAGCTDLIGRTRSGKVTMIIDKYWVIGAVIKANFENYSEEGAKLNGRYDIINNSTLGIINFTFVAQNIKYTDRNGKTTAYNVRQVHNQVGGNLTLTPLDDVYEMTSTISATLPDGMTFEFVNTTPLKKTNTCLWVQKGTGIVKLNGIPMILDFGNDTCDEDATLNVGGVVRNIKLRL